MRKLAGFCLITNVLDEDLVRTVRTYVCTTCELIWRNTMTAMLVFNNFETVSADNSSTTWSNKLA